MRIFLVFLSVTVLTLNAFPIVSHALPHSEVKKLMKISPDFAAAEREILEVWGKIPPKIRKKLQKSQIQWIRYDRDKEAASYMKRGYSMAQAYTVVTFNKTNELKKYLQTYKKQTQYRPVTKIQELKTVNASPGSTLLDVTIQQRGTIDVKSKIDISFTNQNFKPKTDKRLHLVFFSMPHTVRLEGEGFLALAPGCRLPFNIHWEQDKLRVVFPLYILNSPQGAFTIKPLIAGNMEIKWTCLSLDPQRFTFRKNGAFAEGSETFTVVDRNPMLMPMETSMDQPEAVFLSPSKEYRVKQYDDHFEVYLEKTDRLILRKVGTNPVFSPTSRFIHFNTIKRSPNAKPYDIDPIDIYDLLSLEPIIENSRADKTLWAEHDSILVTFHGGYGISVINLPFSDSKVGPYSRHCHNCHALTSMACTLNLENASINCFNIVNSTNSSRCATILHSTGNEELDLTTSYRLKSNCQYLFFSPKPVSSWEIGNDAIITYDPPKSPEELNALNSEDYLREYNISTKLSNRVFLHYDEIATDQDKHKKINQIRYKKLLIAETLMRQELKSRDIHFPSNDPTISKGKNIYCDQSLSDGGEYNDTTYESYLISLAPFFKNIRNNTYLQPNCELNIFQEIPPKNILGYSHFKSGNRQALFVETGCRELNTSVIRMFVHVNILFREKNKEISFFLQERPSPPNWNNPVLPGLDFSSESRMNELKPFVNEKSMAALASVGPKSAIAVLDLNKGEVISQIDDPEEAWDIDNIYVSRDNRWLWQMNKSGRFYLYSITDHTVRLHGAFMDGEWIIFTPEGYYDASPEGAQYVNWYFPGEKTHYSFNQFESRFKRPDMINAILRGEKVARTDTRITAPPRIDILGASGLQETMATSYQLRLSADKPESLDNIRIFVNGRPIEQIKPGGAASPEKLAVTVPLTHGLNRITAVAFDQRGFSSNPRYIDVISQGTEQIKPDLYILGIGVSQYPKLPAEYQLDYPGSDARNLIRALRAQKGKLFNKVKTLLLTNEDVSRANINGSLDALKTIHERDVAVIFMAGHGAQGRDGAFYFLTPEGDFDSPAQGGLSWTDLGERLSGIKGRVIVLIDACHSGSFARETVVPNDELAGQLFTEGRGGIMAFSASKGRQYSLESPDYGGGYGIFTYALTQGLGPQSRDADTSGNGYVEFMELVDYVRQFVDSETEGEQTPWLSRKELFGDLPIAVVSQQNVTNPEGGKSRGFWKN